MINLCFFFFFFCYFLEFSYFTVKKHKSVQFTMIKMKKSSKSSHLQSCNHQMLTIVCCLVVSHYESVHRLWGSGRASPSGSLSFYRDLTYFRISCGIYSEADMFLFLARSDYQIVSPKTALAYITIQLNMTTLPLSAVCLHPIANTDLLSSEEYSSKNITFFIGPSHFCQAQL